MKNQFCYSVKYFGIALLFFVSVKGYACGWYPENELYFFYNIFEQTNIASEDYYPFLRDDNHTFYKGSDSRDDFHQGNLELWQKLLPDTEVEKILAAMVVSESSFEKFWKGRNSNVEIAAKEYMTFARKCSESFAYRKAYSWEYDDILKNNEVDFPALLEEGLFLYKNEKDAQLKMRYAYQVIRIFHYGKQYQEAIDFYTENIVRKNIVERNEIYYYLLDQVAGCYYSLEDFEQAAYLFLKVFSNSRDRKASAFLSYNFCVNKGAEGKTLFKDAEDEIGYLTMKGLNGFSDDFAVLEELVALAPDDARAELLFTRILNNVERKVWPREIGMQAKDFPNIKDAELFRVEKLETIAKQLHQNAGISNKDFWELSSSYLSFLKGNLSVAHEKLMKVNEGNFDKQKEMLGHVYHVFGWDKISPTEEAYLAEFLSAVPLGGDEDFELLDSNWKHVVVEKTAHLYYKHNQLAKSFLLHNKIDVLDRTFSLPLLDDLLDFVAKENKNEFENILLKIADDIAGGYDATAYLRHLKGLYYLQEAKPEMALPYLDNPSMNIVDNDENAWIGSPVSARIFSNNTTECFNCDETDVMVDSVFLADVFSFIKPKFHKAALADYLVKLEMMTDDEKIWKRKLAHYLLGNYYYNITNTGYFRGTLSGENSCCDYDYFFGYYREHKVASDLIESEEGYNLFGIERHAQSFHGLQEVAREHYEKVLEYSADKELNARCLYMMAKCELNALYNGDAKLAYSYDGGVPEGGEVYKEGFKALRDGYKGTLFYDLIIKECSFFRYYCGL